VRSMTMTMAALLAVGMMTLGVSGCRSTKRTYQADGRMAYSVRCGSKWRGCLQKAGIICRNKGYDVAYEDEYKGELMVSCRSAEVAAK
jgi:hypothetical protein